MPTDNALQSTSAAAKAVEFCNQIYHEENLLAGLAAEERYQERLVKGKPLLDTFFAWLDTVPVSGKGNLSKVVNYALHEKKYLYVFLENGNVPIDNNCAENAIRPFAVGRQSGCSAILQTVREILPRSIRLWRRLGQAGWMRSNI